MKRLNPNTGKPFRRGDVREDGKVFKNYSGKILLSGFEGEAWVTPEELAKLREHRRSYSFGTDVGGLIQSFDLLPALHFNR